MFYIFDHSPIASSIQSVWKTSQKVLVKGCQEPKHYGPFKILITSYENLQKLLRYVDVDIAEIIIKVNIVTLTAEMT